MTSFKAKNIKYTQLILIADGVGIFNKIKDYFNLIDTDEAIIM